MACQSGPQAQTRAPRTLSSVKGFCSIADGVIRLIRSLIRQKMRTPIKSEACSAQGTLPQSKRGFA
jgi:hypothetical protein